MKRLLLLLTCLPVVSSVVIAQGAPAHETKVLVALMQNFNDSRRLSNRKWLAGGVTAAAYSTSLIFLNNAWYKAYPRTRFHTFNDLKEWQQMDKAGHSWTVYQSSRLSAGMWQWAGLDRKRSVLLGSMSSTAYMFAIEYLDGRSAQWGWSWGDVGANILGGALYASQELIRESQPILLKLSTRPLNYPDDLQDRANQLFGSRFFSRLLKDYNAQTYWLSINANAFLPETRFPQWLNIALGYGAQHMMGGFQNTAYDTAGNVVFNRTDLKRYRQYYFSPDIDFTKIKTNKKGLKILLSLMNMIKLPAPALELSNGKLKAHFLYF